MTSHRVLRRFGAAALAAACVGGIWAQAPVTALAASPGATAAPAMTSPADVGARGKIGYDGKRNIAPDTSTMAQHAEERVMVKVTDFGADRTGAADSTGAVVAAIRHARSLDKPVTIRFPKGQYSLSPGAAEERELYVSNTVGANQAYRMKRIGMLIEGMHDVIIDGRGSDLLLHGNMTPFAVLDSSDVSIVDLNTDFAAPTVVDLTVLRSGSENGHGFVDVRMSPGVRAVISGAAATFVGEDDPATGKPYWSLAPSGATGGHNQTRTLATGYTARTGVRIWQGATSVAEIEPGVLRVTYASAADPGGYGKVYQLRDGIRRVPGGLISESERVDLQRLDLSYLHGFGIVGQLSRDISLDRIRFRTESGRWTSTAGFADFVQMSSIAGKVQITNSLFDNGHDDPINVHGTYMQVTAIDRASRTVTVRYMHPETAGFAQFHEGDELRFVSKSTLLPSEATYRVIEATGPSAGNLTEMKLTVDGELPADLAVGSSEVENLTYTPEVHIAGNTFQSSPVRGILVTTPRKTVIERNRFDQIAMASIYVSGDARGWYESGPVEDLVIRDNVFERPSTSQPTIFFDPTNTSRVEGRTVHRNIEIDHNSFGLRPGGRVVGGKSVSDLDITDNDISTYAATTPADASTVSSAPLYTFDSSADIELSGNRYAEGFNLRANVANMAASELTATDGVKVNADNQTRPDVKRATLSDAYSWVREDPARWSATSKDAVTLRAGANGLWATQNAAVNMLLTPQPAAEKTVLDVTLDGATVAGYEEAGLIFYVGDDDYVALHRKHAAGSPVLALVTETKGSPNENTRVAAPADAVIRLRLERAGSTFTASYSIDGQAYKTIGSIVNPTVGDAARVGVMAAGSSTGAGTPFTFRDFTIDGAAQTFFSDVPAPVTLRQRAGLGDVEWTGIDFGAPVSPLAYLTSTASDVRTISARFPVADRGTRITVRHDDRVVKAKGGVYSFDLYAGPNVIQVETLGKDGARQTYRWVVISDQPYVDTIPGR